MKGILLLSACLLLAPAAARAQFELGMDGAFTVSTGSGDAVVRLSVPTAMARIGFPGDSFDFETLVSLNFVHSDGSLTFLQLGPGVNFPFGEGDMYVRGEAQIAFAAGGGDSDTQLALGAAVGTKKQIGASDVSYRLEAGYDRWIDLKLNEFRALAGLSVVIGG